MWFSLSSCVVSCLWTPWALIITVLTGVLTIFRMTLHFKCVGIHTSCEVYTAAKNRLLSSGVYQSGIWYLGTSVWEELDLSISITTNYGLDVTPDGGRGIFLFASVCRMILGPTGLLYFSSSGKALGAWNWPLSSHLLRGIRMIWALYATLLEENKVRFADIERYLNWFKYEGWNFNSGNYLFTTDTK